MTALRVVTEVGEGKLCLYVAIDRTGRFAFVQLLKKTGQISALGAPAAMTPSLAGG